jgi:predicted RNA-binding protein Jag
MLFLLNALSLIFLSNPAWSKVKLDQAMLDEYLKVQKEYSDQSCRPGVEQIYNALDLKYRGDGNYIPVTLDQKIDQKTIKAALPLIKEKIIWIKVQEGNIAKVPDFSGIEQTLKRLENEVTVLQEAKKDFFLAKKKSAKYDIEERAKKQFTQMMKEVENLRLSAPFLLSFKSPLNHLALRSEYEKYKNIQTKEARPKANALYLNRRMLQDGSYDENLTRNDAVIRAAFDTLYLSLSKDKDRSFLTENERSDFKYILTNFKNLLDNGQEKLMNRFNEWGKRAERSLAFYQDLADGKKVKLPGDTATTDVKDMIEERSQTLFNLKDFVLKKEADAYAFWSKQSETNQYLYVMETILYAEVGRIDAPDALERRDVAQVVVNRYSHPFYSDMTTHDSLYDYLAKDLPIKERKWLNVLFKEGEFSFTYFYIPGNFHIYCPDMSKVGQYLRRENARIAIGLLNKPRMDFPALRYFSRMSMYGRIEMDSLWEDYKALGEVPGKPVKNPKKLATLFKQDRYKYLYDFQSSDKKKTYLVVEMKAKTYVVDFNNPKQIFYYRNPHQFRYFAPIK